MTKFIAKIALASASMAVMLAQYWFTFGLWPKSWLSFFGFAFAAIVIMIVNMAIDKET